jgi:acyl carrier protein
MTTLTADLQMHSAVDDGGEVWEKVVRFLLAECDAPLEPAAIRPETSLREDLALSSLGSIEAIMLLEDEYDVAIDDWDLDNLKTVGDVVRLVTAKVSVSSLQVR